MRPCACLQQKKTPPSALFAMSHSSTLPSALNFIANLTLEMGFNIKLSINRVKSVIYPKMSLDLTFTSLKCKKQLNIRLLLVYLSLYFISLFYLQPKNANNISRYFYDTLHATQRLQSLQKTQILCPFVCAAVEWSFEAYFFHAA